MHGAAERGFTPFVKFLAEHGADLQAKDANGRTALDLASGNYSEDFLRQAAEPHVETVKLLEQLIAQRAASSSPVAQAAQGAEESTRRRVVASLSPRP